MNIDMKERVLDDYQPRDAEEIIFLQRRLDELEGYDEEPGLIEVWKDEVKTAQADIDYFLEAQKPVFPDAKPHEYQLEKLEKAKVQLKSYQQEAAKIKATIKSFQKTEDKTPPESKPDFKFKNQHGVGRPGLDSKGKPCLLEYAGYPVIDGKINGVPVKEFRKKHKAWMLKRKKGESVPSIFTGK